MNLSRIMIKNYGRKSGPYMSLIKFRITCRNSMPTKANPVRRTVINDPVCDRCRSALEDQIHALWSCPELNEVWLDALLWGFRASSQFGTFKDLVTMIFQK